jgi:hypothetical protein
MAEKPQRHIPAEHANTLRQEEVLAAYVSLLNKIWQRLLIVLGLFTARVIIQRALRLTARQYPLLNNLTMHDTGLDDSGFESVELYKENRETIIEGFETLIFNLSELLTELLGETIVKKLFAETLPDRQEH